MSRALLRSVLELRAAAQTTPRRLAPAVVTSSSSSSSPILSSQPPSSCSRRGFNSTTPIVEPVNQPHVNNAPNPTENQVRPLAFKKSHPSPPPAAPVTGDSVRALLPLLAAQPGGHYITVHIHGFPYLVQEGDQVRLPFRMPGVLPGDVLRLNRASVLGSRDYTLKGAPHVDESLFECRATVLGVESEPLRIKVKTKRRQRRKKQAKSKHRYTILRISELTIKTPDEVDEPSV